MKIDCLRYRKHYLHWEKRNINLHFSNLMRERCYEQHKIYCTSKKKPRNIVFPKLENVQMVFGFGPEPSVLLKKMIKILFSVQNRTWI